MEAKNKAVLIPSIDISRGKCVRRAQGNAAKETVYPKTPLEYALQWEEGGAQCLHVVDLDAANDEGSNFAVIEEILRRTMLPVRVGGGIRNMDILEPYWGIGVSDVIVGTAAVEDEDFVCKAARRLGEHLMVDIGAKDGWVLTHGWTHPTHIRADDMLLRLHLDGVRRIVYTDTTRDGMLKGPNFAELKNISNASQRLLRPIKVTGSGGASCVEDLERVYSFGIEEYIVGEALYKGMLKLTQAGVVPA